MGWARVNGAREVWGSTVVSCNYLISSQRLIGSQRLIQDNHDNRHDTPPSTYTDYQTMLQGINNRHDRPHGNSLAELTAARQDGRKHLLLACSGSVATIKLPEIIRALAPYEGRLSIRLVLTEPAKRFLAGQSAEQPTVSSLARLPCVDAVYDDSCEWEPPWVRGDAVLHIELRRCKPFLPFSIPVFPILGGYAR